MNLVELTNEGLYCSAGDFYIDPWRPVERALITHGHADHARMGADQYFCTPTCEPILRHRLGQDIRLTAKRYGEKFQLGNAYVSFHPAGHVLGSAQVRIEVGGEVWVISGDYKRSPDPSCEPFEVVPCDVFISEATFALPVYSWPTSASLAREILEWWNSYPEGPSLLFGYAFGKTQRILAELVKLTDRTIYLHGACHELTKIYRASGVELSPTELVSEQTKDFDFSGQLILAPPSAHRSAWMKRFKAPQTAFASGWMQIRGNRRRRGYERGFVMSDHADWQDLISTIQDTGARRIFLTHGSTEVLQRYLNEELRLDARPLLTQFEGEAEA
ncbi:MAG: ligase-associated DNA damage response exonuclease [Bdellovibrionales bacterium]|nr:ligase-associated DNA damage response exonuclease [Bdellovibrionales bacterium]